MSDFAELMATVEQVRAERYPFLPAALVAHILSIESEHPEDRTEAMRAIKLSVLAALADTSANAGIGAPLGTPTPAGPAHA